MTALLAPTGLDSGDTAWLLAASALVLLMAPGLALFYGGMVRSKSVLNMIMMTFGSLAVISILWVLVGYSIAFGDDVKWGLVGDPTDFAGLGQLLDPASNGDSAIPVILFAVFQGLFCVITGALVSGAIADRARFGAWMVFVGVWSLLVYAPIAHWIFDFSARRPRRRLDGQQARGHRLRRRHRGRDQLRRLRAGAGPGAGAPRGLRQGADASAQPDPGDARRRPAVVRLVRLQRRLRAGRQPDGGRGLHDHPDGRLCRLAGLAGRRAAARRQGHLARCGLRHRRRTGRDHPVLRLRCRRSERS